MLTDARLKKLENIYLKDLDVVKGAMLRRKRAAYQEAMIEVYQKKVPMIT